MSSLVPEIFRLVDERHEYAVRWLAEFAETHKGQKPIGLIIRCIDSRLFRVMNTDSISRVLGKILEYKVVGNVIRHDDPRDAFVVKYFLQNLDEALGVHDVDKGFIIIEGHSDCGAVRMVHSNPLSKLSSDALLFLAPLIKSVKYVFEIFLREPNEVLDSVKEIVEEAALKAKIAIREKFYPEIFYNKGVVRILRKQLSPNRASMALHFYIALANAMIQVIELFRNRAAYRAVMDQKLEVLASFYDIFSARTYYFSVVDKNQVYNVARETPEDGFVADIFKENVMRLFEPVK